MKIRTGFVSNSSSSSFLIYGLRINEYSPLYDKLVYTYTDEGISGLRNDLWEAGFSVYTPNDYAHYVGLSWDRVGDNETGAQFKARVRNALSKWLGVDEGEFRTYSEVWYA